MESRSGAFRPGTFSDVPLFNIQAVTSATGVASITLRSWERRYGVPAPQRDLRGYRLYSERDLAVVRWLKERVRQGVGISRAVNMLRVLEEGSLLQDPYPTFDFVVLGTRLVDAAGSMDGLAIGQVIDEGLMVASIEEVALNLLQPALYRVGDRWAEGSLSVTCEHVASNVVRAHLARLLHLSPAPIRAERIVVGSAPGELHDIGALVLALFLRRRGFDVVYAGASVESDSLRVDLEPLAPAAVCLSAATADTAAGVAPLFADLAQSFEGVLAFGGRAFNLDEQLIGDIPGHFLGADAGSAVAGLEARLQFPHS